MKTRDSVVAELRRELAFLDRGGYRVQSYWRMPLFFEDSPICSRRHEAVCPSSCALLALIPTAFRDEAAPCRHIPLNHAGETLQSMYSTDTNEEIEAAIRKWLVSTIETLGARTTEESGAAKTKAA